MQNWSFDQWLQMGERLGVPVLVLFMLFSLLFVGGGIAMWRLARFLAPLVRDWFTAQVSLVDTLNKSEQSRVGHEQRQTQLMQAIADAQKEIAINQERITSHTDSIRQSQEEILRVIQ